MAVAVVPSASRSAGSRSPGGRGTPLGRPPSGTGWAAPMLVPGAMAATWAARVTKRPAEAARAPGGATYTTTGTGLPRISFTKVRVDSIKPPGVSSTISRHSACRSAAVANARRTTRTVTGVMASFSSRTSTTTGIAAAGRPSDHASTTSTTTVNQTASRIAADAPAERRRSFRAGATRVMPAVDGRRPAGGRPDPPHRRRGAGHPARETLSRRGRQVRRNRLPMPRSTARW
jgi:hypothetical protein